MILRRAHATNTSATTAVVSGEEIIRRVLGPEKSSHTWLGDYLSLSKRKEEHHGKDLCKSSFKKIVHFMCSFYDPGKDYGTNKQ